MRDYCTSTDKCRRDELYGQMAEYSRLDMGYKCLCCVVHPYVNVLKITQILFLYNKK